MNWQTEKILLEAEDAIADEGIFSPDQIAALRTMVHAFRRALDKESACTSSGIRHTF